MAKRKHKIVLRPWCWYCEREFEDEKVLMQHQKAKHFKCNQCPRRLNTAGGLSVHIQQVHKLDPDQLPRIDNTLPGRDGYEVEIFGMEGIPAPDLADYKRRKEQELGLPIGSISGSGKGMQQNKRPRIEKRVFTEEELRVQLEAHKALMGGGDAPKPAAPMPMPGSDGGVYNAAPQAYAPPGAGMPPPPFPPGMPPPPGGFPPPGMMSAPGQPPFPPFPPGMLPPGMPPPPGMPGFPPGMPPPNLLRPGENGPPPGMPMPPFPPGGPPPGFPAAAPPAPPPAASVPPPSFVPAKTTAPEAAATPPPPATPFKVKQPPQFTIEQTNPSLKSGTVLIWEDANYSPDEKRAASIARKAASACEGDGDGDASAKKRARAEDFL